MNPSDESPARAPMPPSCDLSVIVPTYNYDAWIESALRSVLAQVPASAQVEIVVADDGSTDDTAQVVKALAADLPIRYLHQTNSGPASARNLAMSQAGGRYLMFLDSDDSLQPGCIETTLAFLEQHPEVGLFFTNYDIYDEQGVVTASGVDTWSGFRGLAHREVGDGEWVFSESLTPHLIGGGSSCTPVASRSAVRSTNRSGPSGRVTPTARTTSSMRALRGSPQQAMWTGCCRGRETTKRV
ncbi:hypothetical protein DRQ53_10585 [bacterium]|nr:MAG: hypothetical protein DRQ53_10585 [bacterium]